MKLVVASHQGRVAFSGRLMRTANHGRRHFTPRCPSSSSREADLKQMQDYAAGLSEKLKAASDGSSSSAPPPPPQAAEATGEPDLIEVPMAEYYDTVARLSSNGELLVMDFYTQWCGPCKLIRPILCAWAEELSGKVNFRKFECSKENAPVGKELQVKSVPTFIVYKAGEEVGRVVGKQEAKLRSLIDENL